MSLTTLFRKRDNTNIEPQTLRPLIVVAPDKFKGTLDAAEVTSTIAQHLERVFPLSDIRQCPMADGGEGTAAILAEEFGLSPATVRGHNTLMHDIDIHYFANETTCTVDSSAIVGLAMLDPHELSPWNATTYGIGEFISKMLQQGMEHILLCIGGTATVDGGAGMLQALGARFFDVEGLPIDVLPINAANLSSIYSVDFGAIDRRAVKRHIEVLADVDVPLLPDNNAGISSLDFAMQKGVAEGELPMLRASLENFTAAVDNAIYPSSEPYPFQGTGGGLGYALHRILHCPCSKGADRIITHYKMFQSPRANCIITGEGSFDIQSVHGKVVGTIIKDAQTQGIPVIVVAGSCMVDTSNLPSDVEVITTAGAKRLTNPITHNEAMGALHDTLPAIAQTVAAILQLPR